MIRPHNSIPAVWEVSTDGSFGAPYVAILGALHGNEVGGLRVIERLRALAEEGQLRLQRGTLFLVHGNPLATEQRRRYTEGGTDINRLFSYQFVDELAPEAWTYEHHRAAALRPLMTSVDAMLDLHSATRPTAPFAICDGTAEGIRLARSTGCRVTYGWDGPGMLMEHVSIGGLVAQGKPALSVECGQHDDPKTVDSAWEICQRFLAALGILEHQLPAVDAPLYRLFGRVVKPTRDFSLAKDFDSFDLLKAGEVLGKGEGVTILLEQDAHLLLPTPQAARGEDIVYLARNES